MDLEDAIAQNTFQTTYSTDLNETTFFVETMGCTHNQGDSDVIISRFLLNGAQLQSQDGADVIYVNSCTVKTPSQEKALFQVQKALERGKLVVLGGCVPQSFKVNQRFSEFLLQNKLLIVGVLDDSILNQVINWISNQKKQVKNGNESQNLIKNANLVKTDITQKIIHHSAGIADIIAICTGCLGCCTYCKTVQSRGRLRSFSIEQILTRFEQTLSQKHIKEIWLTGEDTLAWGQEQNKSFRELFDAIFNLLEKHDSKVMIRIGMTDPESVLQYQDDLVYVLKHKNIYKFLHLPVQSASDNVLKQMKRRYTFSDYETFINKLQLQINNLIIATDVIAGFPGESEADFQQTVDYLHKTKPEIVNVTQYYVRDGTIAAKFQQIPDLEKKRRGAELAKVAQMEFNRQKYINQKQKIIISELLQFKNGFLFKRVFSGKSENYLSVLVQFEYPDTLGKDEILGKIGVKIGDEVWVKIIDSTRVALVGVIVE